ncbi:MAG: response regulator [Acidobacteriota bacterium]|nr:response regulator [Acidobacteriota bacterium]
MKKKVLIVEDNPDSRGFMKALVESYGYEAIEAVDGEEAIQLAHYGQPDLVLMDISMPEMDGLTAIRIIRESLDKNKMPIIAVTAHGKALDKLLIEAGCNDIVNKPVDFDTLLPVIEQYLTH